MKKGFIKKSALFFSAALLTAFAVAAAEPLPPPIFSLDSGLYPSSVMLRMECEGANRIYYTTNGDSPTVLSEVYDGGIKLEPERAFPPEIQGRSPQEQTPKAITVRAAAADATGALGEVTTKTYFIGGDVLDFCGLPMVNLAAGTKDLWDAEVGIYSNFDYEHNIPAYFQYFNADGTAGPSRGVEIKVSGHGSRSSAKKSLRVYFNKGDTTAGKKLSFDIIPDARANYFDSKHITDFSKLTFRISDWDNSDLRDPLAQRLGSFTRADVAASTPTALFLNGDFWGIYECREQFDEKFVENHYGIDDDNIVFLDRDWTLEPQVTILENGVPFTEKMEYEGPADGNAKGVLGQTHYMTQWLETRDIAERGNIADPEVYASFCERVDIDNFIDYVINYIYAGNDDWPGNNFKLWRVTEEAKDPSVYGADGKWRFMVHDFDIAYENPWHETLYLSALHDGSLNADDEARHPEFATKLLGSLLKNESFRTEFAQRTMAYLSTAMSERNVNRVLDGLVAAREGAKIHDLLRWNLGWGPAEARLEGWKRNIDWLRRFAALRADALKQQYLKILNENYGAGITGTARFAYYTSGAGVLSINGAEVGAERYGDMTFFGGEQFAGIPFTLSAYKDGEPMTIDVAVGGVTETYTGEATLTPEAGAGYTVTVY